jgi:hypothetical protein
VKEITMTTESNKYIISEFYAFTADRTLIKEALDNRTAITLKGILQKANTLNRNGRKYPYEILKREVDKYNELVRERRALGELDHPDSAVVSLANVSHLVTKMWWEGETLLGEVEILNTPSGDVLKGLLSNGVMLGISSRGVGSVKSHTGADVVQEDFELIAFDFVSSPSTPGAYMFKEGYEANKPGLKRITNDSFKTMRADITESSNNAKFKKISDLSNQDFWKKSR